MSTRERGPALAPHVVALGGVRGVALLAVLAFHFVGHGPGAGAWPAWVRTPALAGWAGVDLFFVLSGFLITRILLASRGHRGAVRVFYLRRALRIFPLYYALLAGVTLYVLATGFRPGEAFDLSALWLYLTNFNVARHGFVMAIFRSVQLAHVWTLAIEEQFYLLWPWLILFAPRRLLLPACGVVIVGATAARVALLHAHADPTAVYVLTYCRADSLAWGAAVALLEASWPANRLRTAGLGLLVASSLGLVLTVAVDRSIHEYAPTIQSVGYSALAAGCAAVVALLTARPAERPTLLAHPGLTSIGRVSYGAYLFHVPLRGVASAVWRGVLHRDPATLGLLPAVLTTLTLTAATLGLAALSYHFFERPLLRFKPTLPPQS